jgi:hypothetical protein
MWRCYNPFCVVEAPCSNNGTEVINCWWIRKLKIIENGCLAVQIFGTGVVRRGGMPGKYVTAGNA